MIRPMRLCSLMVLVKYRLENQLNVAKETPVVQIIEVDANFVGPNDSIVIGLGVGLLGEEFFFIAVFDTGQTRDARAELKDATVVALQHVGIARHIRAWPHEAHLSDEDVDKFGEAVHLAVAQPVAHARNARIVGRGDAVALGLVIHGSELTDLERLASPTDASLHEKHRAFRVDLDEDADDKQGPEEHDKSDERHDTVEAPLEKEPDGMSIFLHVAWPPC